VAAQAPRKYCLNDIFRVTLNNASDYRANRLLTLTPNPTVVQ